MPQPNSGSLADFFDLIALPKGSTLAEVTQTSGGEHVQVVPLCFSMDHKVKVAITGSRLAKNLRADEIDKAIQLLTDARAGLETTTSK